MNTRTHINPHLVTSVEVEAHPDLPDLLTLTVTESQGAHTSSAAFIMDRRFWQQAVEQLADLDVAAGVTA